MSERVLLLAATTAYHTDDFLAAADRLGVEVVLGTDRCHVLAEIWPQGSWSLDMRDPAAAAAQIVAYAAGDAARGAGLLAVIPTDEATAVIAALAAEALGLRHNPVEAARTSANKLRLRQVLSAAGLLQPLHRAYPVDARPERVAAEIDFPVVIKPLHLSASRGVMRADGPDELVSRFERLARLLADPEIQAADPVAAGQILVESYAPGVEVAFEGLLQRGQLTTIAIFDKPDPLEGPLFAETIYVTPSSEAPGTQRAIAAAVAAAAAAMGLSEGPVHAELRLGPRGPVVIEVAARSIGGLCGRTLRYGAGVALEELILGWAVGRDVAELLPRERVASGVMMLPVPEAGVLRAVEGVDEALAVAGVLDVVITARPGDALVPLPEGHAYLGFVFARGPAPATVVAALRRAGEAIRVRTARRL